MGSGERRHLHVYLAAAVPLSLGGGRRVHAPTFGCAACWAPQGRVGQWLDAATFCLGWGLGGSRVRLGCSQSVLPPWRRLRLELRPAPAGGSLWRSAPWPRLWARSRSTSDGESPMQRTQQLACALPGRRRLPGSLLALPLPATCHSHLAQRPPASSGTKKAKKNIVPTKIKSPCHRWSFVTPMCTVAGGANLLYQQLGNDVMRVITATATAVTLALWSVVMA